MLMITRPTGSTSIKDLIKESSYKLNKKLKISLYFSLLLNLILITIFIIKI